MVMNTVIKKKNIDINFMKIGQCFFNRFNRKFSQGPPFEVKFCEIPSLQGPPFEIWQKSLNRPVLNRIRPKSLTGLAIPTYWLIIRETFIHGGKIINKFKFELIKLFAIELSIDEVQ